MNENVFVDTSAMYAVFDSSDRWHEVAARQWRDLSQSDDALHASNYVVVELSTLLQMRLGVSAAEALSIYVLPWLHVVWVDATTHDKAMAGVLAARRRDLSLVDCTSFAIMRSLGLRKVFTFDPHFAEQGFEVLPAQAS
jgi:uncharacterized protein